MRVPEPISRCWIIPLPPICALLCAVMVMTTRKPAISLVFPPDDEPLLRTPSRHLLTLNVMELGLFSLPDLKGERIKGRGAVKGREGAAALKRQLELFRLMTLLPIMAVPPVIFQNGVRTRFFGSAVLVRIYNHTTCEGPNYRIRATAE